MPCHGGFPSSSKALSRGFSIPRRMPCHGGFPLLYECLVTEVSIPLQMPCHGGFHPSTDALSGGFYVSLNIQHLLRGVSIVLQMPLSEGFYISLHIQYLLSIGGFHSSANALPCQDIYRLYIYIFICYVI